MDAVDTMIPSPAVRRREPLQLCCPRDGGRLTASGGRMECASCGASYPIVDGIPVLIDEEKSIFDLADYAAGTFYDEANQTGDKLAKGTGLKRAYYKFVQRLQWAHLPDRHLDAAQAVAEIVRRRPDARILVIGAGLRRYDGAEMVYTDIALHPDLTCVCDAHDLPFEDGVFDGVIAAAVLEHVMDPPRVVAEITRVLAPGGFVYAVTPFISPVHMGRHDYTRWSFLGHRRLFRWFDDVSSGMCGGAGSSSALVLRSLLMSFSDRRGVRPYLRLASLMLTYPLLQLDRLALKTDAGYDAAAAVYFLGAKRDRPVSDREILSMYRGG